MPPRGTTPEVLGDEAGPFPGNLRSLRGRIGRFGRCGTRALRQGLADLGYVEGRAIVIEERYAGGDPDRFPELIDDLLSRNVAVFITGGAIVTQAVLKRTTRVPIVVLAIGDPSQLPGAVASLARPGGTVTGFASVITISGQQLNFAGDRADLSTVAILEPLDSATRRPAW
jgi:hypothetical protein